MSVIIL